MPLTDKTTFHFGQYANLTLNMLTEHDDPGQTLLQLKQLTNLILMLTTLNYRHFSSRSAAWQRPAVVIEALMEIESVIASPQSFATLALQADELPEARYFLLAELLQKIREPAVVCTEPYRSAFNALTQAHASLPKHVTLSGNPNNPLKEQIFHGLTLCCLLMGYQFMKTNALLNDITNGRIQNKNDQAIAVALLNEGSNKLVLHSVLILFLLGTLGYFKISAALNTTTRPLLAKPPVLFVPAQHVTPAMSSDNSTPDPLSSRPPQP